MLSSVGVVLGGVEMKEEDFFLCGVDLLLFGRVLILRGKRGGRRGVFFRCFFKRSYFRGRGWLIIFRYCFLGFLWYFF